MRNKDIKTKHLDNYRIREILIVVMAVIVILRANAYGGFRIDQSWRTEWPINSQYDDSSPFISADGLSLYFSSNRPGGSGDLDLWISSRTSTNAPWSEPVNLGQIVNSSKNEAFPSVTADGLELYFDSDRPGGHGRADLWVSKRSSTQDDWGTPENLESPINSSLSYRSPSISGDGLTLLWSNERFGGFGSNDIWMSTRNSREEAWGEPVNLGSDINSSNYESDAVLSSDSLLIFFAVMDQSGASDIWFSKRNSLDDDWWTPMKLDSNVNTPFSEYCPNISADGTMLFFTAYTRERFDEYGEYGDEDIKQASIQPLVDFNNDKNINTNDLLILMKKWKTYDPLSTCDIGPMPWGDGIVDMNDLRVFIKYWEKENFKNVDDGDNGSNVTLKPDQRLIVTLQSNPSTGYSWEVLEDTNSILEQMGEAEFVSSVEGGETVGAGGWEIFRFKAISYGQMTLTLLYRRTGEPEAESAGTFSIEVKVDWRGGLPQSMVAKVKKNR